MNRVSHYVIECLCGEKTGPGLCTPLSGKAGCGRIHQVDYHAVTGAVRDPSHADKIAEWTRGGPAEPPLPGKPRRRSPEIPEPATGGAPA